MSFRSHSLFLVLGAAFTLVSAAPSPLCLWDRDTLKIEAAGAPGVAEAIVGHFDRFPDLYYEMRLERVAREIEANPSKLALYDDAAVAVERLGRSSEAIAWMAKKRQALDEKGGDADPHQEYTYLANLGTFYVHRWLHAGAARDSLEDLVQGRDLIEQALELNPDAHFGRERWQLMAVQFLIDPSLPDGSVLETLLPIMPGPHLHGDVLETALLEDAVEGLTGLITLGSAWESVDILRALEWALLDRGDGHLAKLTALRLEELEEQGRRSLVHQDPDHKKVDIGYPYFLYKQDIAQIEEFFPKARQAADGRRERRNAFLLERLAKGEHPDTHPNFWKGWKSATRPELKLPGGGFDAWARNNLELLVFLILAIPVIVAALLMAWFLRWRRAKLAQA